MYLSKTWGFHRNFHCWKSIVMSTFQTLRSHSSVFALENQSKNLNFQSLFTSNRPCRSDPFMATFNERRAATSWKYVAKQGIVIPNWSKIIQIFRLHFSAFALEKQPKNPIFQSLFYLNKPCGGYFQWNACTDFQKICSCHGLLKYTAVYVTFEGQN